MTIQQLIELPVDTIVHVHDMPQDNEIVFVSDSQDVDAVWDNLGLHLYNEEYDSFFVLVGDGEYLFVFGMAGVIPYIYKELVKLA